MSKYAVIHVDILNDFVTGPMSWDGAQSIVEPALKLTKAAREKGVPVIFSNDVHEKGIDKEFEIWGEHAIGGTKGAEIIPELGPEETDYIVPKRRYSGFFQTSLDLLLRELGVDTVIITGLHAHCCCKHTSADAYFLGYNVVVPRESTNSLTQEQYETGLEYIKNYYNGRICSVDEIIAEF